MRLLTFDEHGGLACAEFSQDKIPPYAILSHTWGPEEVSYVDLVENSGKDKAGYRKILLCGEQAARDKLRYFWVDTCCIDKRNNTELSEAINSMFRWYRNAAKCYAYLSDVSISSTSNSSAETYQSEWEADFRRSRWFTRGWTLQELLAPASVIFYSSENKQLGDKHTLAGIIQEITGLPQSALDGHPLDTFSISDRMAWAAKRQTTKEEDGAYCLLGIFSIFMPLIYGEGKENALKRLQREIDGLRVTANTCFTVPFERNPRFTGRESILAGLEEKLFVGDQTTKTAIVGLGGIGKTQLALELAYRTRAKYNNCSVFWIPATDLDSLHQAYRDVAQQLRIPGWDMEKADVKKLVQTYLSQTDTRPWLLVFDNVDDIGMWISSSESGPGAGDLKKYMPRSKQGCIVLTTRDKKTAVKLVGQNFIEVPEMDEDGAMQLLEESLAGSAPLSNPSDQQHAKALLRELTYLPLAIVQAAAYMNENSMAPADYHLLLNEQEENLIELLSKEFEDDWRYHSVKNPVATTWLISFEQIRTRDPLAAEYLSFMACIDRKDIPKSLLPAGPSRIKEVEAIGTLRAYSFLLNRGDADAMVFDLHRLVHLATRGWLEKEGSLSQWTHTSIEQLDDLFPDDGHQNRAQWRALLPHAAYVLRSTMVAQDNKRRLDLALKYANSLHSDGRYREAEVFFEEVYQTRKACGYEDLALLHNMNKLAWTYWNQGRWKEAERLQKQVIDVCMREYGEEAPDTMTGIANLAATYSNQGRWKEAEELKVRVMKNRKRVLGEGHPHTLTSIANLALTYRNQGRWKEAEELEAQVRETRRRVLGEEHPDTLNSIAHLASMRRHQGHWKEAEVLDLQVLEIRRRVLGEEHPQTLTVMVGLASTYRYQGQWKKAEELELQVLELRRRLLGEEHPETLSVMLNLASTYRYQGQGKKAEELELQVLELRRRVLGEYHPETLTVMVNLGSTYSNQKRWKEAEELESLVLETRRRILGEEHPHTLIVMANLGMTYRNQGRAKEAEELESQALELKKKVLGEEHPETLTSMNNLAYAWKVQGRVEEAIKLMDECVQQRKKVLGPDHPYTLDSSSTLMDWKLKHAKIS